MANQGENGNTQEPPSTPHTEIAPTPTSNFPVPKSPTRKRKCTSVVWNDFKKVKVDGIEYAICKICNTKLNSCSKNGTSSLHDHLERHKKTQSKDIRQQILQANQRKSDGQHQYRNFVFDQEVSRYELASMIILHEYPLSIVDHVGFRRYSNSLQPMFKLVSRNTIKNDIMRIYEFEKEKIAWLFEKIENRIAITTDMWTAKPTKRGFMAITAHFIDEAWILQSRIIRFTYVPPPHNKEVISTVLVECLLDYNIDRKLSTITVDNATTNDAVIPLVLEKLNPSSLLLDGRVTHMRCCAHILNLIVKDGLDVIGEGIERIRDSVLFWTATRPRIEKFEDVARQLKVPCTKKPILDCKTRWNSTYHMLHIAIMYKDVFPRLKQRERLYTRLPSEFDWDMAKELCGKLKLFNSITELFSGTSYPTTNLFFPNICEIKLALSTWIQSPIEVIRVMASKMKEKYDKYWDDIHVVMAIAVVLDPRFKMKLVDFYFPLIYGNESWVETEKVKEACYDLLFEYQSRLRVNEDVNAGTSQSTYPLGVTNQEGIVDENDYLSKYDRFVNSSSTQVPIKSELDFYLEESVLPRTPNFDVLSYWKTQGCKFPTLQMMARDILAIPITSVASESAFSTGGRVLSPHRNRLHPTTMEALMCAQSWLWSEFNVASSYSNSKVDGIAMPMKTMRTTICDEEADD